MEQKELIELVAKACKKENEAMEKLYKEFYEDVYFVCKKYDLSDEDAADITQDTFIKAFDSLKTIDNATKFRPWVLRIASNSCLNLLKHKNIIDFRSIDDEERPIEIEDDKKSILDSTIDKEIALILSNIIDKLPIEQKTTVFMYYYEDMSVKEIAESFGCSENTVRSRLNYARKAMRIEAEKLEDKGVKLRVVAALPFLYTLYKMQRQTFACEIPMYGKPASSTVVKTVARAEKTSKSVAIKIVSGIAAAVIVGGVVFGITKALSDKDKKSDIYESKYTSSEKSQEKEDNKDSDKKDNILKNGFEVCDIDMFGEIRDSEYIAFLMYNTEIESGYYDKNVLAVADFGSPDASVNMIKEGFRKYNDSEDDESGYYNYGIGLGNDKIYVTECATNADGSGFFVLSSVSEINDDILYGNNEENWDRLEFSFIKKRNLSDELYPYKGQNWYANTVSDLSTDNLSFIVGENDDYYQIVTLGFQTPVAPEDNSMDLFESKISNNEFKNTILIVDKDMSTVDQSYGKNPKLNLDDVVFYNDIQENAVSDLFGLNIKDKNFLIRQNPDSLIYIKRDGEYNVKRVNLVKCIEYDDVGEVMTREYYNTNDVEDSFSYTDSDNNLYEYFVESKGEGVHIFKNGKYTGSAYIDGNGNELDILGELFGIRR